MYIYVYIYVCLYICVCIYVYVYIHINICIHQYTVMNTRKAHAFASKAIKTPWLSKK